MLFLARVAFLPPLLTFCPKNDIMLLKNTERSSGMKEKVKKYLPYLLIVLHSVLCAVCYELMLNSEVGGIAFCIAIALFFALGVAVCLLSRKVLAPTLAVAVSVFAAFLIYMLTKADDGFVLETLAMALPLLLILSAVSSVLFVFGTAIPAIVLHIRYSHKIKLQSSDAEQAEEVEKQIEDLEEHKEEIALPTESSAEQCEDEAVAEDKPEDKPARSLFASLAPVFAVLIGYIVLNFFLGIIIRIPSILVSVASFAVCLCLGRWARKRSGRMLIPTVFFGLNLLTLNILLYAIGFVKTLSALSGASDMIFEYILLSLLNILTSTIGPTGVFLLGGYIGAIWRRLQDVKKGKGEQEKRARGFYPKKMWIVYASFIALIVVVCGFVLIYNADTAFDGDAGAGYIPPSFLMIYYTFAISLASVVAAVIMKLIMPRTKILILLLCALVLPYAQYVLNMSLFKGALAPTIKEGGAFYFIANHDFNFDGYNDELYQKSFEERTVKCGYKIYEGPINDIKGRVTGKGKLLGGSSLRLKDENGMVFAAGQDTVISRVEIDVTFSEKRLAETVKIYLVEDGNRTLIDAEMLEGNKRQIILGEDECARIQKENKRLNATFEFEFDE